MLRALNIFMLAVGNERDIDGHVMRRFFEKRPYVLLRPLKTARIFPVGWRGAGAWYLLNLAFLLFSPLFFLWAFLFSGWRIYISSTASESLVFLYSERVLDLLGKSVPESEHSFVYRSKNGARDLPGRAKAVTCFKDRIKSLYFSCLSVWYVMLRGFGFSNLIQCYCAYDWFLSYFSLARVKGFSSYTFSNHYDRWAVLFDCCFLGQNLRLIQHGVFPVDLSLRYKLKGLNSLYLFSESELAKANALYDMRISKAYYFVDQLSLADLAVSDRPSILIIGTPMASADEVFLSERLLGSYDVYIKPHPRYDLSVYKGAVGAILISDQNFFPKVDLALCYDSTLGLQYEASGVPVIWWIEESPASVLCKVEEFFNV